MRALTKTYETYVCKPTQQRYSHFFFLIFSFWLVRWQTVLLLSVMWQERTIMAAWSHPCMCIACYHWFRSHTFLQYIKKGYCCSRYFQTIQLKEVKLLSAFWLLKYWGMFFLFPSFTSSWPSSSNKSGSFLHKCSLGRRVALQTVVLGLWMIQTALVKHQGRKRTATPDLYSTTAVKPHPKLYIYSFHRKNHSNQQTINLSGACNKCSI